MFSSSFAYIYGEFIIFLFCHDFHGSMRLYALLRSMTNKNLSGTLSPAIGKIRSLRHL